VISIVSPDIDDAAARPINPGAPKSSQAAAALGAGPTPPTSVQRGTGWFYFLRSIGYPLLSVLSVAAGLVFWHLAVASKLDFYIRFENIPSPTSVFNAFVEQLTSTSYYVHVLVSLKRILISYLLACLIGIVLGFAMARSRIVSALAIPYIEIVRPIPAVAWIPIAILAWPTEEGSIIYITFLGALFPIVLNTIHGVETTPEVLIRAARSLGASRFQVFRYVILPAALPSIAAGLVIAMGVSWFSLLAGEIISGQFGIGYFTWDAYSLINYQNIVVGMISIGVLGTLSTYAIKLVTCPALRWQRRVR
jgi:NitT/TauT family transport system permease protein